MPGWIVAKQVPYPSSDGMGRQYRFLTFDGDDPVWVISVDQARLFDDRDVAHVTRDGLAIQDADRFEVRHINQHPKPELRPFWGRKPLSATSQVLMDTIARGDSFATIEVLQARAVAGVESIAVEPGDFADATTLRADELADAGYAEAHRRARRGRYAAHLERVAAIGRGEIRDDPALVLELREQLAELERADDFRQAEEWAISRNADLEQHVRWAHQHDTPEGLAAALKKIEGRERENPFGEGWSE